VIAVHAPAEENSVWAKLDGAVHRHRGADAVFSRFVGTRRHDAALSDFPSDDNRFSPVFRIVQLFNGREEGIEIDVKKNGFDHIRGSH
jgi:hypothetical protein